MIKLICYVVYIVSSGFGLNELRFGFINMHSRYSICLEKIYYSLSYGYSSHSFQIFSNSSISSRERYQRGFLEVWFFGMVWNYVLWDKRRPCHSPIFDKFGVSHGQCWAVLFNGTPQDFNRISIVERSENLLLCILFYLTDLWPLRWSYEQLFPYITTRFGTHFDRDS